MPLNLKIDSAICGACGMCVRDCPNAVLILNGKVPAFNVETANDCIECQHCFTICPTGALSIFGLQAKNSSQLQPSPTYAEMKNFIRARRSMRQYQESPVDKKIIAELLRDLAHSPTGCNDRALIFSVIENRATMEKYLDKVHSALTAAAAAGREISENLLRLSELYHREKKDVLFRGAPHLLLVSLDATRAPHTGAEDVIIALTYFEMLANSAGLGTTWLGMLKFVIDAAPELRKDFNLPADGYFYAMLFGKPQVKYARGAQRDQQAQFRVLE